MDAKIHFKNQPFTAVVQEKGETPIECTPIVYDEPFNFGVGIMYAGGGGSVWGMVTPRNMIASWRGTEILRRLTEVKSNTLCFAYYAGLRNPHSTDLESRVKPMIEILGQKAYDEIMSMPIPEEIIRAILDNQKDKMGPSLHPIIEEVRAGTIKWRQEFTDAGIQHPDQIDAEAEAQRKTIAKFEKLLQSYAKTRNLSRHCLEMKHVEGALLTIVKKDGNKEHPDHVLVALAGVVGDLAISEFASTFMPLGSKNTEKVKRIAIERSAQWLTVNWEKPFFTFFASKVTTYNLKEAQEILVKLLDKYFPVDEPAV